MCDCRVMRRSSSCQQQQPLRRTYASSWRQQWLRQQTCRYGRAAQAQLHSRREDAGVCLHTAYFLSLHRIAGACTVGAPVLLKSCCVRCSTPTIVCVASNSVGRQGQNASKHALPWRLGVAHCTPAQVQHKRKARHTHHALSRSCHTCVCTCAHRARFQACSSRSPPYSKRWDTSSRSLRHLPTVGQMCCPC